LLDGGERIMTTAAKIKSLQGQVLAFSPDHLSFNDRGEQIDVRFDEPTRSFGNADGVRLFPLDDLMDD